MIQNNNKINENNDKKHYQINLNEPLLIADSHIPSFKDENIKAGIFSFLRFSSVSISEKEVNQKYIGVIRIDGEIYSISEYDTISKGINLFNNDAKYSEIEVIITSGGGIVSGVDTAWQSIRASKLKTTAIIKGYCYSAALWIASACNSIISDSELSMTGSIGAIIIGYDNTDYLSKEGYKRIVLRSTNSTNKALPITDENHQKKLVSELDDVYNKFVESVAIGRNLSIDDVKKFADGSTFDVKKALEFKLIDDISYDKKSDNKTNSNTNSSSQNALSQDELHEKKLSCSTFDENKLKGENMEEIEKLQAQIEAEALRVKTLSSFGKNHPSVMSQVLDAIENKVSVNDFMINVKLPTSSLPPINTTKINDSPMTDGIKLKPNKNEPLSELLPQHQELVSFIQKYIR